MLVALLLSYAEKTDKVFRNHEDRQKIGRRQQEGNKVFTIFAAIVLAKHNTMIIIHANDPTTQFLSQLYETREDVTCRITEASTNVQVLRAIREADIIMMLGHGNEYGLFSKPNRNDKYDRFLITGRHVEFLRGKICIGIWCYADQFAKRYGLTGLFTGMIISELQEAIEHNITTTKEEIDRENIKFASRLRECLDNCNLKDIPVRMQALDDVKSELTRFNYGNVNYF